LEFALAVRKSEEGLVAAEERVATDARARIARESVVIVVVSILRTA
jgi:hypothetical protein